MPVQPAAPADVTELVAAYRQTMISFADVADGLREEDWDRPTSLPGWSARDVLAHVVHIEDYLSGSEHPVSGWVEPAEPVDVGTPEHVRNAFAVWNEEGVRARDDRSPAELVAELRGLVEVRSAIMYDADLDLDTRVRTVRGREGPFGDVTRLRIVDVWMHEQDLRDVVDRPGSLDSPGASQFMELVMDSLCQIVLHRVRPEPGTVVILESTGPVMARGGVRIGSDADGEPVAHELFTGHTTAEDAEPSVDDESADRTTTISMSTYYLARRAAGRVATADTAYHVVGDEDLAVRVLDALTVTP